MIIDMMPHERDDLQLRMGHVWRGFNPEQMHGWLADAGFAETRYVPLSAHESARGPVLFTAGGRASGVARLSVHSPSTKAAVRH